MRSTARDGVLALALAIGLFLTSAAGPGRGHAAPPPNMVIQWNAHMLEAFAVANVPPPAANRLGGLIQAAVFDAVNGIEGRYTPIHVSPAAAPAPYVFSSAVGQYQPTPGGSGPPRFRTLATTMPFAMTSPSEFRPAGPPPLSSARYAQDFNEVQSVGALNSATRNANQTETA